MAIRDEVLDLETRYKINLQLIDGCVKLKSDWHSGYLVGNNMLLQSCAWPVKANSDAPLCCYEPVEYLKDDAMDADVVLLKPDQT